MELIKEVDFQPLDKFVVTFEDFRTYRTPMSVVDKAHSTADETVTKMVKKDVKYNHQICTVVATPKSEADITAGDKLFVDFRACMPLDGYDNLYMVPKYNVLGVVL